MAHLPDHYTYPAILQKIGDHYGVYFPDLPGCIATGAAADEAFAAAKEGLALHLWGMEQDGDTIPKPSAVDTLQMKQGDVLCLRDESSPREKDAYDSMVSQRTRREASP